MRGGEFKKKKLQKVQDQMVSLVNSMKQGINTSALQSLQKIEQEETLPNSFYKHYPDTNLRQKTLQEKNYSDISDENICRNLQKILAN